MKTLVLHAFIQDYCSFVCDYNAREMRKIAALGVDDDEKEYAFTMFATRNEVYSEFVS